jgi:hypothetical protein
MKNIALIFEYYIYFVFNKYFEPTSDSTEGVGDALMDGPIIAVGSGSLIKLPNSLPRKATDPQEPWMNERGVRGPRSRCEFLVLFPRLKKNYSENDLQSLTFKRAKKKL